jgi:EAL domain-containing protein (putative c-di-GMP-specific phosphodiesterase class I)
MPCSIAVNLPPGVFQDLELPDRIAALRERFDLEPTDLQIEITEQVLDEGERPVTVAAQLASRGIAVALDDFGAGYSALQRLVRLPLHTLKIDRSIVMQMTDNPRASVVVESAVELARALGLQLTIAEGVETPELLQRLRGLGVDAAQGYVISRPLPADEFTAWLRANAATRPAARPAVARPLRGPSPARS